MKNTFIILSITLGAAMALQSCQKVTTEDPDKKGKQDTSITVECPTWEDGFQGNWLYNEGALWDTSKARPCQPLPDYKEPEQIDSDTIDYERILANKRPRVRSVRFKRGSVDSLVYLTFVPDANAEFPWEGHHELWHGDIRTGEFFKIDSTISSYMIYYYQFFMDYSSNFISYRGDYIYDIERKRVVAESDSRSHRIQASPSGKHYFVYNTATSPYEITVHDIGNAQKVSDARTLEYVTPSWLSDSLIIYGRDSKLWLLNPFNGLRKLYKQNISNFDRLVYAEIGSQCSHIASTDYAKGSLLDVSEKVNYKLNSEFFYGRECGTVFLMHMNILPNQQFLIRLNEVEVVPRGQKLYYHEKWLLFDENLDEFREVELKLPME